MDMKVKTYYRNTRKANAQPQHEVNKLVSVYSFNRQQDRSQTLPGGGGGGTTQHEGTGHQLIKSEKMQ